MHELSITHSIVNIVVEHAAGRPVRRVKLQIGKLSGVQPDAVRFCFDLCAQGTVAEGARLEVEEPPGQGRCQRCERLIELEFPLAVCNCAERAPLTLCSGQELLVKEMEL